MSTIHDIPSSAHQGKGQRTFFGGNSGRTLKLMYLLVTPAVRISAASCRHALAFRVTRQAIPYKRYTCIFLDIPRTEAGNEYILMIVDSFTKWVDCVPLPSQTAEVTARSAILELF